MGGLQASSGLESLQIRHTDNFKTGSAVFSKVNDIDALVQDCGNSSALAIVLYQLIEWRIYASVNWAIIDSDNGLPPVRHQAINSTNAGLLLNETFQTH